MGWLEGSYVGTTKKPEEVFLLQKWLYKEGFFSIVATPMGGNMILLTGNESKDVYSTLKECGDCLQEWFSELLPWKPAVVSRGRTVWLKVTGGPVHVWGEQVFKTIVALVGKFVCLDEATQYKERFDMGRVLVVVSSTMRINRTVNIKVNDLMFPIKMVEDVVSNYFYKDGSDIDQQSDVSNSVIESYWDLPESDMEEVDGEGLGGEDMQNFQERLGVAISNSNPPCQVGSGGLDGYMSGKEVDKVDGPKEKYTTVLNASSATAEKAIPNTDDSVGGLAGLVEEHCSLGLRGADIISPNIVSKVFQVGLGANALLGLRSSNITSPVEVDMVLDSLLNGGSKGLVGPCTLGLPATSGLNQLINRRRGKK